MIVEKVRAAAAKHILYLPHALRQMARPERMISSSEIKAVVHSGELIEDYPEDARGHSCLLFGWGVDDHPIHVVCSPKDDYLAIITAYIPSADEWNEGFRERK